MARILLQFFHPALENSRANRFLRERALQLESVEFNDLYQHYPDFDIDVPREKEKMEAHDSIVFQFPFYWYSGPALLKQWFDLVLEYGWAYGKGGDALAGKKVRLVATTGAAAHAYEREGHNYFTMEELLRPIEQTFRLCGMRYGEPFIVHRALHLDPQEVAETLVRYERWLQED